MKITGIESKKCTACECCVKECPANLFSVNGTGKAGYSDPNNWCTGCGHCTAVCPNDAINYEAYEKAVEYSDMNITFHDAAKLLLTKRSVRRYKNKDIPKDKIERLLELIRFSPSGHNAQPCEYIVIKDIAIKRMLAMQL